MKFLKALTMIAVVIGSVWTVNSCFLNPEQPAQVEETQEEYNGSRFSRLFERYTEADEGDCIGSACNRNMPSVHQNTLGCDVFISGLRVYDKETGQERCPNVTRAELNEFARQWIELNGTGQ